MDVLCTTDGLTPEPEDVNYAIMRLLERGYFYAVDEELIVILPSETR